MAMNEREGRLRKGVCRFGILLCVILGLVVVFQPYHSRAAEDQVVRIGYMDYHGFIDQETDGSYSGYGAEYLAEIAKYTGYRYEYVYGEWADLLVMLKNQEIDFLCTAQYTEARAQEYEFSRYPIGYTQGLLYTRTGNEELAYEDFETFEGMHVGVIKNSAMHEMFERYQKQHKFQCVMEEYAGEELMMEALNAGRIDAMCSEHLANHTDLLLLARFGADAYYMMSYKDSPYMEEVNGALQQIKADVDFESGLYHEHYDSSTAETTLQFTREEREFIQDCGTIRVGFLSNRVPFSSYDETTGTFSGICVDIMDEIAKETGLTFAYVPMPVGKKAAELMESGEFDIICGVEKNNFATSETLAATEAFLESTVVPAGCLGHEINVNSQLIAAVPASFQALQKTLENKYPNITVAQYNSNRDCADAVLAGEADIMIQNTHIISLLLQEPRYENLDIMPVEIMTEHTAMVMPKANNDTLLSIINKSISYVDEATISSCLIRHTFASPYQYTTGDFIYKFRVQIIIIGFLVMACFTLLAAFIIFQERNEVKLQRKNALLAEAVNQAERASVAKSKFLSHMSHEIRTPMNAIVGLTEIARHYEDNPEKVDDYLNKIGVSSKVLLNIINDVLDMSAIESNKLKIAHTEFDIKQVLNGISTIYYPQCDSKGIHFDMATDVEHEILMGDSLRVNQILLNFISNAYKFTDPGGKIKVFVEEMTRKDQTAFMRFTVSDTGCGMTKDMQERLFKPFEQETSSTAKKHGGSGLGLSIAKNLIDMMHGAVTVESEKDKGTTFTIDLPFEIVENPEEKDKNILETIRVLVVDDDAESRDYTAIVLNRLGVDFDMADSGVVALEMMEEAIDRKDSYDVCMIDWKMPDMDGIELTRRIRMIEDHETMIIIISSYDLNEVQEKAKGVRADHFVTKPLFQSTVFNVLMTLSKGQLKKETADVTAYDFSGHRVLLAEDNEINAEIAMELLQMVNMAADRAEDGQEALEMFQNHPEGTYDVILMDVQMPTLDGYEATKAIRKLERKDAQEIPILAMTANAFTEDVAEALSAGMNGHIAKPIDTKVLYQTLEDMIAR